MENIFIARYIKNCWVNFCPMDGHIDCIDNRVTPRDYSCLSEGQGLRDISVSKSSQRPLATYSWTSMCFPVPPRGGSLSPHSRLVRLSKGHNQSRLSLNNSCHCMQYEFSHQITDRIFLRYAPMTYKHEPKHKDFF